MSGRSELRIGLVMYGGLSLAVYMNGMTQEILALVRASHALKLARQGKRDSWVGLQLEHNPYCRLLEHAGVDVVVDVIAGTSAGGLNGLMLAKALAGGAPDLEGLTELWIEAAQIRDLASADQQPRSLLSGDYMLEKLKSVMADLSTKERAELADQVEVLDLFVTATDLGGHVWVRRDGFGQRVEGLTHRYLFHLKKRSLQAMDDPDFETLVHGYDQNDFTASGDEDLKAAKDALLAKIGRATSAFPGIFPPIKITREEAKAADTDVLADVRLPEQDPDGSPAGLWFSDGGILVNKPFQPVIETIAMRSAHTPVRRALVFMEPDPVAPKASHTEPHMLEAVIAGLTLPMSQDIKGHLDRIEQMNRYRQELHDLVEALDASLSGEEPTPAEGAVGALQRAAAGQPSSDGAPGSLEGYHELRRLRVQRSLKGVLSHALEALPFASDQERKQAREAVVQQLNRRSRGCLEGGCEEPAALEAFLKRYDTAYSVRRLQFLLGRIHKQFRPGATPRDAAAMERMLKRLWSALDDWWRAERMLAHAGHLKNLPERWQALGAELNSAFKALAETGTGLDLGRRAEAAVAAVERLMDEVRAWATAKEEAAVRLDAAAALPLTTPAGEVLPPEGLRAAWEGYEARDVLLFLVSAYGTAGEMSPVTPYRFSPRVPPEVAWVQKPAHEKVAGEALGHIAAFFDRRWRANDIMWGRLDAVDLLVDMVLRETEASDEVGRVAKEVQAERRRRILAEFEEDLDQQALAKLARRYGVPIPTGQSPSAEHPGAGLSLAQRPGAGPSPAQRPAPEPEPEALRQVAAAAMPAEAPPAGLVEGLPDEALREYLERYHKVGEEKLSDLPARQVGEEFLLILNNAAQAIGRSSTGIASWLKTAQKPVLTALSAIGFIARTLLTPREGLLRVVQENVVWLMAAVAVVVLTLQAVGVARLTPVVWAVVLVLLFPQLFHLIFSRYVRPAKWAAGVLLAVTGSLRLLLWERVTAWWSGLEPLAEWAQQVEGIALLWPLFAAVMLLLIIGRWMVPRV